MQPATAHAFARGYGFGRMDAGEPITHDEVVLFADEFTEKWTQYHRGHSVHMSAIEDAYKTFRETRAYAFPTSPESSEE